MEQQCCLLLRSGASAVLQSSPTITYFMFSSFTTYSQAHNGGDVESVKVRVHEYSHTAPLFTDS